MLDVKLSPSIGLQDSTDAGVGHWCGGTGNDRAGSDGSARHSARERGALGRGLQVNRRRLRLDGDRSSLFDALGSHFPLLHSLSPRPPMHLRPRRTILCDNGSIVFG